jgi:putative SOS response-associated peptidase YedK
MCYHYSVSKNTEELEQRFTAKFKPEYIYNKVWHNNGYNHTQMPIITDEPNEINMYNWGLIPHWVKTEADEKKLSNQTLNAKGETVFDLPSFKMYIGKKRCLVLADGFYEWMHVGKEKYPHYIYMKDKQPFAFAGIYSHWKHPETNEVLKTYSILTTEANPLMKRIHNSKERMPVILRPDMERQWLKPYLIKGEIQNLILPLEDEMLSAHTISKLITSRTESSNQEMDVCEYPELVL